MNLHIPSAFVGAGLLVAGLVTTAFVAPSAYTRVSVMFPVEVKGIPTYDQLVSIPSNQPYTVPAGKVLVMTTVTGTKSGTHSWDITVNGTVVASASEWAGPASILFWGIPAFSGSIVHLSDSLPPPFNTSLLGYLADV